MKGEETMNIDKIKEIIKNKKVQAISGAVAGALIIAVAGTMILHNNNIENKNVAIENKLEDNKEELAVEDTDQDKEVVENTNEHIHDENCNHDDENSTSQENKQEVAQNSDTDKKETTTESSDKKATTTTQTSTTNSNKNDSTSNSNTNKNEHTHSWVEVYKDVYHSEEGHYENVLVKEAWTESVPVYEEQARSICNGCGKDITGNPWDHIEEQALAGNYACGGYHTEWKKVQTGTNTITHDAVYEKKWIVDKAAWTEKVLSGYKCSSCGAIK